MRSRTSAPSSSSIATACCRAWTDGKQRRIAVAMSDQKESVTRISGGSRRLRDELHELSEFREVLWFLAWRDIKVRYRQGELRGFWGVLQPPVLGAGFTPGFCPVVKRPGG